MNHLQSQKPHWLSLSHLQIRWLRYLIPLVLLGLAVHVLLPKFADLEKSWKVLRQMSGWLVGLAVLCQIGRYVGSGLLLQGLVQLAGGNLKLGRSMIISIASASIGLVAAGAVGSMLAMYNWILSTGINKQGAGLTAVLKSVFTNGLLFLLSVIGLIYLLLAHDLTSAQIFAFGFVLFVLLLLAGGLIWGVFHPVSLQSRLNKLLAFWSKLRRKPITSQGAAHLVQQLTEIWSVLRSGGWHRPLAGAIIRSSFDALTIYILFIAAHHPIGFGALLIGYGLPLLLGKVSFLPGGVGVVEATMTAVYAGLGVRTDVTVVVILGYRLLSFWIPLLFGFPLAVYLQRVTPE
ncbi:MAG: UPF0104 family protein [Anaerolineales bacterium]|nr:UPF0104 family protein [Anaerolineales bacterium]